MTYFTIPYQGEGHENSTCPIVPSDILDAGRVEILKSV